MAAEHPALLPGYVCPTVSGVVSEHAARRAAEVGGRQDEFLAGSYDVGWGGAATSHGVPQRRIGAGCLTGRLILCSHLLGGQVSEGREGAGRGGGMACQLAKGAQRQAARPELIEPGQKMRRHVDRVKGRAHLPQRAR